MKRKIYLKLTSLVQAREIMFQAFAASPLQTEKVPLAQARGRTMAENAAALVSSPAFHGAAMDGVALAAEKTFGASERRPKTLRIGSEAWWVNTGRPLPPGCNAVVMVEDLSPGRAEDGAETVSLEKAAFPWQHVRKLGEDLVATESILPPGTLIGAYELGALGAAGVLKPLVYKKPLVDLIPSGSELAALDEIKPEMLVSGEKLPEFNSLVLTALTEDIGGTARTRPIVPDDPEKIRAAILASVLGPADLVVVNAGSSAGSHDFTAEILAEMGELLFHGVSIMPGKPTALGRVENKPVLGIPGYPVSAVIAFEEFGQQLLARWQGLTRPERPEAPGKLFSGLPSRPGMEEYIRVKLGRVSDNGPAGPDSAEEAGRSNGCPEQAIVNHGNLIAVPLPRGAGTVTSLSRADGIILVPAEAEGIEAGRPVKIRLIRSPREIDGALMVIGSHDNALDLLDSRLRRHRPGYRLTSAHLGSLGGLMALKAGQCHLAGSHLLGPDGIYNQAAVRENLKDVPVRLVRLADRVQGLILPPGNPLDIRALSDLTRPELTFINRQRGSGTRVLLDWELGRLGLSPDDIRGYEDEEYTHMNVAAAVAGGRASAGLGVKAAAAALGLEFVPVGVEEYDMVIPDRYWSDPRIQALLEVIRSDEFKSEVQALGGYGLEHSGEIIWASGEE